MNQPLKELLIDKPRHTRVCKLCGNRYPMSGQYFVTQRDKPDIPGLRNAGLLYVCKMCQAHWGPTLSADVAHMARLLDRHETPRTMNIHARSFIDVYGSKKKGAEDADAA